MKTYLGQVAILLTVVAQLVSGAAYGQGNLCEQVLAEVAPRVAEAKVPTAAETFEKFFTEVTSPKYQKGWIGQSHNYRDFFSEVVKANGLELVIMKKLGFEINQYGYVTVPSLKEFIQNYELLLNELNIPEAQRIRPAIALMHKLTGEVRMVRIGMDPWPSETTNWSIPTDVRLRARLMAQNISEGRFPVFSNGLHDVFHLFLFAMHPEYVTRIKAGNAEILSHMSKGFMSRVAFNLEALSLVNPDKAKEISEQVTLKKPTSRARLEDFQTAIEQLNDKDLLAKAEKLSENYNSYLVHYSAGMRDPFERAEYNSLVGQEAAAFSTLPIGLLASGLAHLAIPLERDYKMVLFSRADLPYHAQKVANLRKSMALVEYALWKGFSEVTLQQWMNDTMKPDIDLNSPTFQYILTVFGKNSYIYQLLARP